MTSHVEVPCEVTDVQMQWILRLPLADTTSIGPVSLKVFVHRRIWLNAQPALATATADWPVMFEPNLEWIIPAALMADIVFTNQLVFTNQIFIVWANDL